MRIELGDYLYAIDEDLEGKVVNIKENRVFLLCQDDFEHEFFAHQLFRKGKEGETEHQSKKSIPVSVSISATKKKQRTPPNNVNVKANKQAFDLHLEAISAGNRFNTDYEALLFQLDYARNVIYKAIHNRIRRIVFIHGVGKGRLREELRKMIDEEFVDIECFDGSYREYGNGATEINIHQFSIKD